MKTVTMVDGSRYVVTDDATSKLLWHSSPTMGFVECTLWPTRNGKKVILAPAHVVSIVDGQTRK